jgi:hypothetical protein
MNPTSDNYPSRIIHPPVYVAGIDLAGEAEVEAGEHLKSLKPRRDSTVITIGELTFGSAGVPACESPVNAVASVSGVPACEPLFTHLPLIKIVNHYAWTGCRHSDLYPQIVDLLQNVWHCRQVVVDSTGIGQPVASFLRSALGSKVVPFEFTAHSKSMLGFNLLASVNSGRLKMYAADGSPEYKEFWWQMEHARSYYRPNRTLNFYVDPSEGHDDYLMSLALLVHAAGLYSPRSAHGS